MDLGMTSRVRPHVEAVRAMIVEEIAPLEAEFHGEVGSTGDRFAYTPRMLQILEGLKAKARERGLWNFWKTEGEGSFGLSTVEYAYLAEEMGRSPLAPEIFNCNAPDTGNMEVLSKYGTPEQQATWLQPLMLAEIRSAYLKRRHQVLSSDRPSGFRRA